MLGKRGPQRGLFEADTAYGAFVGRDSFYGWLASQRGELFRDEAFAGLYVLDNGRPSVPPSLLAVALVLQTYDGVSDDEAKQRADYDLRWKVALGVELDARPFAKSTLQEFRAQLIVHEEQAAIFRTSLELARRRGKFRTKDGEKRKLKVALDTTNILGRGAVKDTDNLLGDGILKLARVLAKLAGQPLTAWAEAPGYGRYVGPTSLKGTAAIDWGDASERRRLLGEIVADADRLLEQARLVRSGLEAGSAAEATLVEAAGLLSRVLVQDVERQEAGPALKQGVAKDRLLSVHDPELRHGRKSASKRFDGHKAAVAVDTDEPLILRRAQDGGRRAGGERAGCRGGVGAGRAGRGEHRLRGRRDPGGLRLRQRRDPPGVRRRRPDHRGESPDHVEPGVLPEDGLRARPRGDERDLPSRPDDAGLQAEPGRRRAVPLRGGGLCRLPAPRAVRQRRPDRRRASPGAPAASGPGVPGQPGLRRLSAPTPDRRAPHRAAGPVGH